MLKQKQKRKGLRQGTINNIPYRGSLLPLRTNVIPDDLEAALAEDVQIKKIFSELAYSPQKEYIEWITSAKKAETRSVRIEKALQMIVERKRLK